MGIDKDNSFIFMLGTTSFNRPGVPDVPLKEKKNVPVNLYYLFFYYFLLTAMTLLSVRTLRVSPTLIKSRTLWNSAVLAAKASENPYTKTILLPKTKFPLRAEAAKREHLFRDRCTKELYEWQVIRLCHPLILSIFIFIYVYDFC